MSFNILIGPYSIDPKVFVLSTLFVICTCCVLGSWAVLACCLKTKNSSRANQVQSYPIFTPTQVPTVAAVSPVEEYK